MQNAINFFKDRNNRSQEPEQESEKKILNDKELKKLMHKTIKKIRKHVDWEKQLTKQ